MDLAIVKIVVLMKNSYSQKYIIGLLATSGPSLKSLF